MLPDDLTEGSGEISANHRIRFNRWRCGHLAPLYRVLARKGVSSVRHSLTGAETNQLERRQSSAKGASHHVVFVGLAATALLILLAPEAIENHHQRSHGGLVAIKWHAVRDSGATEHGPHRIDGERSPCLGAAIGDISKVE